MLLDRVFPLVRLTGQLAYVSRIKAFPTPLPMFALWVVKPHHVIPHLKLLFLKSFNSTIIFSVQFSLFEAKFLTVCYRLWHGTLTLWNCFLENQYDITVPETAYGYFMHCKRRRCFFATCDDLFLHIATSLSSNLAVLKIRGQVLYILRGFWY